MSAKYFKDDAQLADAVALLRHAGRPIADHTCHELVAKALFDELVPSPTYLGAHLRNDAFRAGMAIELMGNARPRHDSRSRTDDAVWPRGVTRESALAMLAGRGLTANVLGVPFSSCVDATIIGALSAVLPNERPATLSDEPTDKDRRRAARELQRADGFKDAPTEAERERRIDKRARKIAWDRAYAARVVPVYNPK